MDLCRADAEMITLKRKLEEAQIKAETALINDKSPTKTSFKYYKEQVDGLHHQISKLSDIQLALINNSSSTVPPINSAMSSSTASVAANLQVLVVTAPPL